LNSPENKIKTGTFIHHTREKIPGVFSVGLGTSVPVSRIGMNSGNRAISPPSIEDSERQACVALLGRRDEPTDAVEEYCRYLRAALRPHGFALELARVPWHERGWPTALQELRGQSASWRGISVLVQYTALAWSRRGFPLRFLRVLRILRAAGARVAVVFHDVAPYSGRRFVDRLRRRVQLHAMREALHLADVAVFTVPVEKLSWVPPGCRNTIFIPVGANLPLPEATFDSPQIAASQPPTVAVFGITGGKAGRLESEIITETIRFAAKRIPKLRLLAFGRHADHAEPFLREGLRGVAVDLQVSGVLPSEEVVRILSSSAILLFVRGPISSRRGSAIAGIACGLPVIAYAGAETAAPITEAGVILVSPEEREELGEALVRVLSDREYRTSLAERSRRAYEQYFSWKAIAVRYAEALRGK
jgi:glycosyltransferase involved in cell wall biosynthesis